MQRAVFLDRDGVITIPEFRNGRSFAVRSLNELRIYADAPSAIAQLKAAGFLVVVVTNQPDVGKGLVSTTVIEKMHERLSDELEVDDIEVCFDTRENASERRKPGAGMLIDAAQKWQIDLTKSFMVGDRASDIEAGQKAGCQSIFIDHNYSAESKPTSQIATVTNLQQATDIILAQEQS